MGKVLKLQYSFGGVRMKETSAEERETHAHDSTGLMYLAAVLVPLVIGSATYALFTYEYRSFYSWFIHSAAKSVYAFGFLVP